MAAEYLVTAPPGTFVEGVGFVKTADAFTAPEGYVPSRTMKPLNAEAVEALAKVKEALAARAVALREQAKAEPDQVDRKSQIQLAKMLEKQVEQIVLTPIVIPVEKPAIRKGLSMSELAHMNQGGERPAGDGKSQGKGGRAADR